MAYATFTGQLVFGNFSYGTTSVSGNLETFTTTSPGGPAYTNFYSTNSTGAVEMDFSLHGITSSRIDLQQTGFQTQQLITFTITSGSQIGENLIVDEFGGPPGPSYTLANDGSLGTFDPQALCFAEGTLIRTTQGDVAVETLEIGDLVVTASGNNRPIKWLGHRRLDGRQHLDRADMQPIRIAAHAFAPDKPELDLYLSPNHAIAVTVIDEVLIRAKALINGATITRAEVDEASYWHVELDRQDLVISNGLPSESYIDFGNRDWFAGKQIQLDAEFCRASLARYCRPLMSDHGSVVVQAARERLQARALELGWRRNDDPMADLHLVADGVVIRPDVRGTKARFTLPNSADEVWLCSPATVPREVGTCDDRRRLGVDLWSIMIDDGFSDRRNIPPDDTRLTTGFHRAEDCSGVVHRWTDGRARLPRSLWQGCHEQLFLTLELGNTVPPRWIAPPAARQPEVPAHEPRLRLVANG